MPENTCGHVGADNTSQCFICWLLDEEKRIAEKWHEKAIQDDNPR